jgi:hypothetical protein
MSSTRHLAFITRTPWKNGKPDIPVPAGTHYWVEWPQRLWHAIYKDHYLTLLALGTIGTDVVCAGVGDDTVVTYLKAQGVDGKLLKTAWQDPQEKTWLLAHGVQEENGKPLAPIVYQGDDAEALGDDMGTTP